MCSQLQMTKSKRYSATRPYQTEARAALEKAYQANQRALLCLPTQSGKTWTALKFLEEYGHLDTHIIFWSAHLSELLSQTEKTYLDTCVKAGRKVLYWNAKDKPDTSKLRPGDIVFTQIQSTRTFKYSKKHRTLLVVDETHREAAKTYRNFEKEVDPDWKMGLTATPYRLDGEDLGYDTIAYQKTLLDLASIGWLAQPRYVKVSTDRRYDLKISGDFTKSSMEELGKDLTRIETVASHYLGNIKLYGQTVIFAPSVKCSNAIAEVLQNKGVKAASLSGKSDALYREVVVNDFKKKRINVLVNVQLFTEGFSSDINTVMLAKPTISKTMWLQMVGRGAGINDPLVPPCQDQFFVVDFVDNINMYPLVAENFSVELLGAKETESYTAKKEEEEQVRKLKKKASTEEELKLIDQARKKGKILDMIGYMKICNNFKSGKEGKYIGTTYPIFKQELPYFIAMFERIKEARSSKDIDLYSMIQSSYERGGNQTNLTRHAWIGMAWQMNGFLNNTNVFGRSVFETHYLFERPNIRPDTSLISMDEPLKGREEFITEKINNAPQKYGKIQFVKICHSTIFFTIENPCGYYWRGIVKSLEESLSLLLHMPIHLHKI